MQTYAEFYNFQIKRLAESDGSAFFQRRVFNGRFSETNGSMVPRTYGENEEAYQRKSFQSGLRNRNT